MLIRAKQTHRRACDLFETPVLVPYCLPDIAWLHLASPPVGQGAEPELQGPCYQQPSFSRRPAKLRIPGEVPEPSRSVRERRSTFWRGNWLMGELQWRKEETPWERLHRWVPTKELLVFAAIDFLSKGFLRMFPDRAKVFVWIFIDTWAKFHQHNTRSFCAGRLMPVKYKPKT